MSLSSLSFLIEEAARNIKRNGLMSLAALTTVAASMAVLGGALFALFRLHQSAEAQPRQFEIAIFLQIDTSRDDALAVKRRVGGLEGVAHVGLFPREQALQEMEEQLHIDKESAREEIDATEANPLPDRLDVRLADPHRTRRVSELLADRSRFPEIAKIQDAHEDLEKLFAAELMVRNVGAVAAVLLFLGTSFVIQNTIRLTVLARRREIRIMQLVGATPGFIRFPMVLEGIFYGVAGAIVASGLIWFVVHQMSQYTARLVSPLALGMPPAFRPEIGILILAALGALIGWAGSVLSLHRFLKRV